MLFILGCVMVAGCQTKHWRPYWSPARPAAPSAASKKLMATARKRFNRASDAAALWDSIAAYHKVIAVDPGNCEALCLLGNQYVLAGTAYTRGRWQKKKYFRLGARYCELAMYTNPAFRQAVQAGKTPWEAADTLTAREAPAMLFWVMAVQYEFKECMFSPEQIANVGWMRHCLKFLKRITAVAPDFGGGAVEFSTAICYLALPGIRGGDRDLAEDYMIAATRDRADWLFGRWARGKYYNKIRRDRRGVEEDLKWVATRDLSGFKDPYPWRVHFRDDARRLLRKQ